MMTKSGRDSLSVFLQQNRASKIGPGSVPVEGHPPSVSVERFQVRQLDPLIPFSEAASSAGVAAPAEAARDVLGEIVALLKEKGPLAASAMIDALSLPVGQVVSSLEQLERYGLVRETRTETGVTFSAV